MTHQVTKKIFTIFHIFLINSQVPSYYFPWIYLIHLSNLVIKRLPSDYSR